MLILKAANLKEIQKEWNYITELPEDENGFINRDYGVTYEKFQNEVLPRMIDASEGKNLKPGHVPQTSYFLWDEENIIGLFRIRHELNESLRNGAGHIGYGIKTEYRGLGYATKGLALMIEKAKEIITEDEIYMSVDKNNTASLRVQIKNKAYIHHEDEEEYYTRIPLK